MLPGEWWLLSTAPDEDPCSLIRSHRNASAHLRRLHIVGHDQHSGESGPRAGGFRQMSWGNLIKPWVSLAKGSSETLKEFFRPPLLAGIRKSRLTYPPVGVGPCVCAASWVTNPHRSLMPPKKNSTDSCKSYPPLTKT